jgi:Asp-tRNA(Asn)/Glu-tRNA(Gln) amidotransferase A subunit family amidase
MSHAGSQTAPAATDTSSLVMLDALALAGAISSREVSCVEVMKTYLDHIERINPHVNAIVALRDRASLFAEAEEKDAQLARHEWAGPLHGFPHAVKDLVPVRGMRMTMGSPILKDFVPTADSVMVGRLQGRRDLDREDEYA